MRPLAHDLWWLPTGAANAYVWRGEDGLTVVDPGLPGGEGIILEALEDLGGATAVTRIVLTHWHGDHSGAAAALAEATGATIHAGAQDAAVLRGERPGSTPDLTDSERPMYEAIASAHPENMAPPRLDAVRDLHDSDELGSAATVVHLGGHTPGSIALHLPQRAAVLTGDVAMRGPEGGMGPGFFHADRVAARAALDVLARLAPEVFGFGHGEPLTMAR